MRPQLRAAAAAAPATGPARLAHGALLVVCCLALAALSLLAPSSPTYDPWAWLIWGRQIVHLDLITTGGPSWKPLPVAVHDAVLAARRQRRAAAVAGRRARRRAARGRARLPPGGTPARPAARVAAAGPLLADRWPPRSSRYARGSSEGLLVALVLWAVERHLDGRPPRRLPARPRRRRCCARRCGRSSASTALWLMAGERREGTSWRTSALVVGGFVALGVLWFIPEYIGSGNFLRAASRAKEPVAGSPAESDNPFLVTFTNGSPAVSAPVYAGAAIAVVLRAAGQAPRSSRADGARHRRAVGGRHGRRRRPRGDGFTGNLRYVLLPAALLCVLAGVGWAQLFRATHGRFGAVAAGALVVVVLGLSAPFVGHHLGRLHKQINGVRAEARRNDDVPNAIARAGGKAALLRCGHLYTDAFSTTMLAWYLDIHQQRIGFHQQPPGTTFESRGQRAPTIRGSRGSWARRSGSWRRRAPAAAEPLYALAISRSVALDDARAVLVGALVLAHRARALVVGPAQLGAGSRRSSARRSRSTARWSAAPRRGSSIGGAVGVAALVGRRPWRGRPARARAGRATICPAVPLSS